MQENSAGKSGNGISLILLLILEVERAAFYSAAQVAPFTPNYFAAGGPRTVCVSESVSAE